MDLTIILAVDLVEIDQLAYQLLLRGGVGGQVYHSFCALSKAAVGQRISVFEQLRQSVCKWSLLIRTYLAFLNLKACQVIRQRALSLAKDESPMRRDPNDLAVSQKMTRRDFAAHPNHFPIHTCPVAGSSIPNIDMVD